MRAQRGQLRGQGSRARGRGPGGLRLRERTGADAARARAAARRRGVLPHGPVRPEHAVFHGRTARPGLHARPLARGRLRGHALRPPRRQIPPARGPASRAGGRARMALRPADPGPPRPHQFPDRPAGAGRPGRGPGPAAGGGVAGQPLPGGPGPRAPGVPRHPGRAHARAPAPGLGVHPEAIVARRGGWMRDGRCFNPLIARRNADWAAARPSTASGRAWRTEAPAEAPGGRRPQGRPCGPGGERSTPAPPPRLFPARLRPGVLPRADCWLYCPDAPAPRARNPTSHQAGPDSHVRFRPSALPYGVQPAGRRHPSEGSVRQDRGIRPARRRHHRPRQHVRARPSSSPPPRTTGQAGHRLGNLRFRGRPPGEGRPRAGAPLPSGAAGPEPHRLP